MAGQLEKILLAQGKPVVVSEARTENREQLLR